MDYPKIRFTAQMRHGWEEVPDKLWRKIMSSGQARVNQLRKSKTPFRIVEWRPNAYRVEQYDAIQNKQPG